MKVTFNGCLLTPLKLSNPNEMQWASHQVATFRQLIWDLLHLIAAVLVFIFFFSVVELSSFRLSPRYQRDITAI